MHIKLSVWPIFSPNQIAVFWRSISWRQRIYWYMDILRCIDMFLITKILDLAYVQNYMRCLSQNKSDTKLFRVYLFTVFTIYREDSDKYTLNYYLLCKCVKQYPDAVTFVCQTWITDKMCKAVPRCCNLCMSDLNQWQNV